MKKITLCIIAGLLASVATADITGFRWSGGSASDGVTGSDYVLTVSDADSTPDILAFISGGQIAVDDLQTFTEFSSQLASIIPVGPAAGQWGAATINSTDDTLAGKYVWAIVSDSSTIAAISAGSDILVPAVGSTSAGPILAGTIPPTLASVFNPGSMTTITVVPEPATIGLFGLGALGVWILRRIKTR